MKRNYIKASRGKPLTFKQRYKKLPKLFQIALVVLVSLFINRIVKAITGRTLIGGALGVIGLSSPDETFGIRKMEGTSKDIISVVDGNKSLDVENYHKVYANEIYSIMNKERFFIGFFTSKLSSGQERKIRDIIIDVFGNHVLDAYYGDDKQYQYMMAKEIATIVKAYGLRSHENRDGTYFLRWFMKTVPEITLIEAINLYYDGENFTAKVTPANGKNSKVITGNLKDWFMNNPFINKNSKFDATISDK